MECFSEPDAMSYALCRVKQLPISEKYRREIIRWIDTYLNPEQIKAKLTEFGDSPEEYSIKEYAEKDLEVSILFASREDRQDSGMILFESQLLLLFNLLLRDIEEKIAS
ncbi:hypothetical protein J2755_002007 [Methanohalophilus levihalophilus]|uniref:hypothetical protein n=1 Tax=Methanohalophilus levihalophilus TaxID=1431282 RepID=UPI001AE33E59|nr:hypothetical protein [Methanohalophilus levihalophilus]MBP2031059.1 hypothetical protein [Methanohalophilus levihalophilus]